MHVRGIVATGTIVVLFPLGTFGVVNRISASGHASDVKSCEKRNELRDAITSFLDSTLQRAQANAEATIASPSASPDQKQVAQRNLDNLGQLIADEHSKLVHENCHQV